MNFKSNFKKMGAAALATTAISSMLVMTGGATPAHAGQSPVCNASVMSFTKASSADGALLPNAQYVIQSNDPNVYFMLGDQSAQANTFNTDFNSQFAALDATPAGQAIIAAYQQNLGTTMVTYPSDITGITDPATQATALPQWQSDPNGTIAAFRADVQRRLDAMNAALTANPDLQVQDTNYYNVLQGEITKLNTVMTNLTTATTTTDWNTFVTAYKTMVDPANWSYGLAQSPSLVYVDYLNGVNATSYSTANAFAAQQVGATHSITVTTDANGAATFTVFGVKDANADAFTRGDNTCSQLTGTATEAQAPSGFNIDPNAYSFVSLDNQSGSLAVTDDPTVQTDPPVQTFTDTGLGVK